MQIALRAAGASIAAILALAACSAAKDRHASSAVDHASITPTSAPPPAVDQLVVLGDSISTDTSYNCVGCTIFPDQLGHALSHALHRPVDVQNLSVPGAQVRDLLHSVRTDPTYRYAIAGADAILINIGWNDVAFGRIDDPCHVAPHFPRVAWRQLTHACMDHALAQYRADLEQVLTTIDTLRDGKPTMLRLTTVYNSVIGDRVDPTWNSPAAIAPSTYVVRHMVQAQCAVVEQHGGRCADVYHVLNGKTGLQSAQHYLEPADPPHLAAPGEDAVARTVIALGFAPLTTLH